jgi:hypothetical protein
LQYSLAELGVALLGDNMGPIPEYHVERMKQLAPNTCGHIKEIGHIKGIIMVARIIVARIIVTYPLLLTAFRYT